MRPRPRPEADGLVEARGRGIGGAQPQDAEAAARRLDHALYQRPADAAPTAVRQDVEVADPADPWVAGVRIDVQAAHADQAAVEPGAEQGFSGTVEAVGAVAPLVHEPAHEADTHTLAVVDESVDVGVSQRGEGLSGDQPAAAAAFARFFLPLAAPASPFSPLGAFSFFSDFLSPSAGVSGRSTSSSRTMGAASPWR
jgi:hypothetical protein